jgi:pyroglutamyl-peptidase
VEVFRIVAILFMLKKLKTSAFVSFSEDTVVVTGFGPFGDHKINASWEIVKLLPSMNVEEEFDVKLIIHEIPVAYEYVAEKVPFIWKAYNPMVCICILLEYVM